MKRNELRIFGDIFAFALAFAFLSMFSACSDDRVAGGSSDDAGVYAVKDLDVAGVSQKGPFVKGSAVTVQGIDCQTMELTGEIFEGTVKSDKGDFGVDDVNLSATCALFEVTGYYFNEVTGKKSANEVTLHALSDLSDRKHVNINMLTELEYKRVMNLVSEEKMSFADAKKQAEKEVLASFNVNGDYALSEDLNIFENGDGNAALLAVSVLVQVSGDSSKNVDVAERVDNFSTAIAENGTLDNSAKTEMADWAATAESNGQIAKIRRNLENLGYAEEIASFENVVEDFAETVIAASSESSSSFAKESSSGSSSSSGETQSSSSSVTADMVISSSSVLDSQDTLILPSSSESHLDWSIPKEAYLNPNITYGEMTDSRDGQVYKTVKIGSQTWMAQNLNYADSVATPSIVDQSWCYDNDPEKCKVAGRLYTWDVAVEACPDGWRLPTNAELDTLRSLGGRGLASQIGWADENVHDFVGFSLIPAGILFDIDSIGFTADGMYTDFWSSTESTDGYDDLFYTWQLGAYVGYNRGMGLSVRCVSNEIDGNSDPIWSVLPKEVYFNPEIKYDSIVDSRDGQVYKTVKIGKQVWMAENLNYSDSVKTPSLLERSGCFENDTANCKVLGRFYTWAAAIDSVKLARNSNHPLDCGYGKKCGLDSAVQGICPDGWHLPTDAEWRVLFSEIGGSIDVNGSSNGIRLKSQYGWYGGNGSDEYGFSVIPMGKISLYGNYINRGDEAWFWTATESSSGSARYVRMDDTDLVLMIYDTKYYGYNVRCVKD